MRPDEPLQLSAEDRARIKEWLDERWPDPAPCPVCNTPAPVWVIGAYLMSGLLLGRDGSVALGQGYPFVAVYCKTCAYTRLFNAIPMGLVGDKVIGGEGDPDADAG